MVKFGDDPLDCKKQCFPKNFKGSLINSLKVKAVINCSVNQLTGFYDANFEVERAKQRFRTSVEFHPITFNFFTLT